MLRGLALLAEQSPNPVSGARYGAAWLARPVAVLAEPSYALHWLGSAVQSWQSFALPVVAKCGRSVARQGTAGGVLFGASKHWPVPVRQGWHVGAESGEALRIRDVAMQRWQGEAKRVGIEARFKRSGVGQS